jgi:hypothetical protein
MKTGDRVKMSEEFKKTMNDNWQSRSHINEFGDCVGIVEDLVYEDGFGDEFNIRWETSGLRYGYSPDQLTIIEE